MGDGVYNENGQCVNCGKFHPCNCEIEVVSAKEPNIEDSHELVAIENKDGYDYDSNEED